MLIVVSELFLVVLDFLCVFVEVVGGYSLVVLVGLCDYENLLVEFDGCWVCGVYLLVFFWCYFFVLVEVEGDLMMIVCLDCVCFGFNID